MSIGRVPLTDDDLAKSAATLQDLTRRDMLAALLEAKSRSDVRDYDSKAAILRDLLRKKPKEFAIDSEANGIVGLTHKPLGFRIHLPRRAMPDGLELERWQPRAKVAYTTTGEDTAWSLRDHLESIFDTHTEMLAVLKVASELLPDQRQSDDHLIAWNPDTNRIRVFAEPVFRDRWSDILSKVAEAKPVDTKTLPLDEPWVPIKKAHSELLRGVTDLAMLTPGPVNQPLGGPRPLAATLAGGLLGGGLGYLGGAAAEAIGGDRFLRRNGLRKTMALIGGLAGAVPGGIWAGRNLARYGATGPFFHDTQLENFDPVKEAAALEYLLPDCVADPDFVKAGFAGGGFENDALTKPIDVDAFGRVIWSKDDPYTSASLRAATMGIVDGASMLRDNSPTVRMSDMARIAAGMGSGYLAGTTAGVLGSLAGLSSEAQSRLQEAGIWTGILKAVVPPLFGR